MKRVFAALILVVFLFNIMGYYFVFSYNHFMVRSEMKNLIKAGYFKDSFIVLKVDNPLLNKDFRRVGPGEFIFRDQLYDIIKEEKEGNSIVFLCINDKNEEDLLSGFHRYFEASFIQGNPAKAKHAQALLYHVIKLALSGNTFTIVFIESADILFASPFYSLFSVFFPPSSPPPEVC